VQWRNDVSDEQRNEWVEAYEILQASHRAHAGYFSHETDRAVAEWGVLQAAEGELRADGQAFFTGARHRGLGNDPPDCEAITLTGELIGIEITEFVDGHSAAKARVGAWYQSKNRNDDLIPSLGKIIRTKDAKLRRGPYARNVLLIHSDEALELAYVQHILAEHVFPETQFITRAYLVTSYDPWDRRCHCIRLNIEQK
jgi:hypothetical protein